MEENSYIKLCGGLFFTCILSCRRSRQSARETMFNGSDGLSEPNILGALIKTAFPTYVKPTNRSFSTNTTRYKQCDISNGAYLPFNDSGFVSDFDETVLNNYNQALSRMTDFCKIYMDVGLMRNGRINYCIKTLLDVIAADESISLDQKFYVMPDGRPLTKTDLASISHVYYQPFLLGIWHFIIVNRPDNSIGAKSISDFNNKYIYGEDKAIINRTHYSIAVESYLSEDSESEGQASIKPFNKVYDYRDYLDKTKNKYQEIKTLLYNDTPRKFYDFYVCNYIGRRGMAGHGRYPANIMKLVSRTVKRIIITGTGGLGKSMMMRHLLLSGIEEYETTKIVPLFVPLKNYTERDESLLDYIFRCIKRVCDMQIEQLVYSLKYGEIALLLDGLDEIKTELVDTFQKQLEDFVDAFPNVIIVMSSRPFQEFVEFHRFAVLELQPFTKDQAIELIDKLEFRPDEPDFKEKFKSELDRHLFDTHREFCTNPLLLTIMLMTFEQFAEIPSKMHVFYREAYLALSQKHDASKGGFKRALKSGLSAERFSDYLSEFCMRTYHDEKFEFTHEEFCKYFNSLKERNRIPTENVSAQSFLDDLRSGMCLVYYESGKYHFTHRSFQEYFCASFFSKQKDKTFGAIGDFFESKKSRMRGDMTFNMLYDMVPDHVEEYIILPFLEKAIERYKNQDGYWTYLLENYSDIGYEYGEVDRFCINEPNSFLMKYIVTNLLPNRPGTTSGLPYYEEFVEEVLSIVEFSNGRTVIMSKEEVQTYDEKIEVLEDQCGAILSADIREILGKKDEYSDMLEALNDDNYDLKSDYNALLQYYEELKKKQIPLGDSFFDIF